MPFSDLGPMPFGTYVPGSPDAIPSPPATVRQARGEAAPTTSRHAGSRVLPDSAALAIVDAMGDARQRFDGLLDAVVAVGEDLHLPDVLTRIVRAAVELSGARYGALGVIGTGAQPELAELIVVGLGDDARDAIEVFPLGLGVLALPLTEQRAIRIDDIAAAPDSVGFPPGHPPMRTFLGVPVRVRERIFGILYLTEKADGQPFTQDDEDVVIALSAPAAVAIENARLFGESEKRRHWLTATAEVTQALSVSASRTSSLRLVTELAVTSAGASGGAVVTGDGDLLQIVYGTGDLADAAGCEVAATEDLHRVLGGDVLTVPTSSLPEPMKLDAGPALLAPLPNLGGQPGLLLLTHRRGQSFAESDIGMAAGYATQAGMGLALSRSRDDQQKIALLEDRDRIARDLHDLVIQRLFATGMSLQAVQMTIRDPAAEARIEKCVDDIDTTIRDLRQTIFSLRRGTADVGLRASMEDELRQSATFLGFEPRLRLDGPVGLAVPPDLGREVLAVVRECLSNTAKHAHASSVTVHVTVAGGQLTVVVSDDGEGMPAGAHRESGLANLRVRAAARGGAFSCESDTSGTRISWSATIPDPA